MKTNDYNPLHIARSGRQLVWGGCCLIVAIFSNGPLLHGQIEGFIEPFREIDLSSDETGAIFSLQVAEGDPVKAGDVIAKLDDRLQKIQVEIAAQIVDSRSQVEVAERAFSKRTTILNKLEKLYQQGHAGHSEVVRAEMEFSISEARLQAAKDELAIRGIELRRAEVELRKRMIVAPFDGVVSTIYRREGEFLSPIHPEVVKLIQIDKVLATFAVPSSRLATFQRAKPFQIEIGGIQTVTGKLHSVSVQTDAQSGTVKVTLEIDNPGLKIRSGELCVLLE